MVILTSVMRCVCLGSVSVQGGAASSRMLWQSVQCFASLGLESIFVNLVFDAPSKKYLFCACSGRPCYRYLGKDPAFLARLQLGAQPPQPHRGS